MSKFTKELELPGGELYDNADLKDKVVIRAMTTKEERTIYGGQSTKALDRVIEACIEFPEKLDTSELFIGDKMFLLFEIRMLTYGDEYNNDIQCPLCNEKSQERMNLSDLLVKDAGDLLSTDILGEDKFASLTLPMSEDEVKLRLLKVSDLNNLESTIKKRKKLKQDTKGLDFILTQAYHLHSVNGEELSKTEKQKYIEELHARDGASLRNLMEKLSVGHDFKYDIECPSCEEEIEVTVTLNKEFFRPSFD